MKTLLTAASTAGLLFAAGSAAAEFNGGEVRLGYSQFFDELIGTSVSKTTLDGSFEYGFTEEFALQLDLGISEFGASNFSGDSYTLHGMYGIGDAVTLGAFFGRDSIDILSIKYAGAEIAYENGPIELEAFGMSDLEDGGTVRVFGLYADYDLNDRIAFTANLVTGSFDSAANVDRYSVGMRYNVSNAVALTADVGSFRASSFGVSDSEPYFSLGAEFGFGKNGGTTFSKRSIISQIPGL
ncbi:MAG: hypothetical protein ACU0A6_09665 [Shimia sp.]|uniref:hypothetical protein n=1 Tax=Shimia sp. TaxID=1954381 RepID=UPI0040586976